MTGTQIQKGLLPAGLSDILYPKAQVQAKKLKICWMYFQITAT